MIKTDSMTVEVLKKVLTHRKELQRNMTVKLIYLIFNQWVGQLLIKSFQLNIVDQKADRKCPF